MRKRSVVFFNRVYPSVPGATGRLLHDLALAFEKDGWDVTVVTTGPVKRSFFAKNKCYEGSIRVVRACAPIKNKQAYSYIWVWVRLFWTGLFMRRPDLIVTMTDPPMLVVAGSLIAKFKRCKHIHWCHDVYPDVLQPLGVQLSERVMRSLMALSRWAMKRCNRVIVIGRCMGKYLTCSGIEPHFITVIPNWPDKELRDGAAGQAGSKSGRARKFKLNRKVIRPFEEQKQDEKGPRFRVLYSGNLGRAHPIRTIVEAVQILNREQPDIEFVFVGAGLNYERLARERGRRGLENVRLLPFQPASRLLPLMESGDIHLVSMRDDISGLLVPSKFYSSLAVGRPCIFVGPDDCETARVIDDFKAGVIIKQGDAEGLAQAILEYRMNGETWFKAHEGAVEAGQIFVPEEAIAAWIKRARDVVNGNTELELTFEKVA